jgi:hypothetical protein
MEIIFYTKSQYCRTTTPNLNNERYRPHLVVKGQNEYLGVEFIEGENVVLGESILAVAECIYEGVNYESLQPNVSFVIMEGANKVGEGKIIERLNKL